MFVDEEKVWPGIVGDGNVGPAVVIEIRQHHAHSFGLGLAYSGRIAHVGEGSVVIVVKELDALPLVVSRMAVGAISRSPFAAPEIILGTPLNVVRHDQIKPPVFVVIEPPRAGRPSSLISNTSLCRNVGESAVPIVVVKDPAPVSRDVKIGIAVVVKVANSNALAVVTFTADAGFFRDIGEGSIAVVVIKRTANRMRWLVEIRRRRLNEVKIHQAVLIVIDPCDTGSHSFEIILFLGLRGVLLESDLRALTNVGVVQRDTRFGRLGRLGSNNAAVQCEAA